MCSFFFNLSENIKNILDDEHFAEKMLTKKTSPLQTPQEEYPTEIINCFSVLGISPTKDLTKIKKTYREQIKKIHPDTNKENSLDSAEELEKQKKAIETLVQWLETSSKN